jgi:hypothetical protein
MTKLKYNFEKPKKVIKKEIKKEPFEGNNLKIVFYINLG